MREELEEYELEDPKLSVPFLVEMDPFLVKLRCRNKINWSINYGPLKIKDLNKRS